MFTSSARVLPWLTLSFKVQGERFSAKNRRQFEVLIHAQSLGRALVSKMMTRFQLWSNLKLEYNRVKEIE